MKYGFAGIIALMIWNSVAHLQLFQINNDLIIKTPVSCDKNRSVYWSTIKPLRKKCPSSELFWSTFSCIWTEYGEILRISRLHSEFGEMQTRITPNTDTFHVVNMSAKVSEKLIFLIILETIVFQYVLGRY